MVEGGFLIYATALPLNRMKAALVYILINMSKPFLY